jgi:hypothetical protein
VIPISLKGTKGTGMAIRDNRQLIKKILYFLIPNVPKSSLISYLGKCVLWSVSCGLCFVGCNSNHKIEKLRKKFKDLAELGKLKIIGKKQIN